jgi:hypothetical protein
MLKKVFQNAGKILVASREAGGAQVVSSMIKEFGLENCVYCLEGPAEDIFRSKLDIESRRVAPGEVKRLDTRKDIVLTGTSWIPELERKVLAEAADRGVKTFSALDHWTNYRERFLPRELWKNIPADWKNYLPDNVIVFDKYAFELCKKLGFPEGGLVRENNFYLAEMRHEITLRAGKGSVAHDEFRLLYISEPIRDDLEKTYGDPDYWGYDEFFLARELVRGVSRRFSSGTKVRARFRQHPNESKNKYDFIISECPAIEKSVNEDIVDDLAWCDAVLGGESMALVIAAYVGKPVYSFLPENSKKKCALPEGIVRRAGNIDKIFEVNL